MKFRCPAFNIYLVLITLAFAPGCHTSKEGDPKKELSSIRLHVELTAGVEHSAPITVHGVPISIEREAFLTEKDLSHASVIDAIGGGYSMQLDFDSHGTLVLDMTTASSKGRRVAIFTQADKPRWLGAPVVNNRNANGMLVFTPDCTREEAERIVRGLNNTVKKLHRGTIL